MAAPLRLSQRDARRLAVRAQLLSAPRPAGIIETVYALTSVNIEPTAAIMPSADHLLWSRLGWPYQPADLRRAVEVDRDLFEWDGAYRLMSDLPLFRARMARRPEYVRAREWLQANAAFHRDVLGRLRAEGPLHAADIPDTAAVSWQSTGWTHSRNSMQMLEILLAKGEVAVWGRDAKGRLFDLAERVYPSDLPEVADDDAHHELVERRLAAQGIARLKSMDDGAGVVAVVEGVAGQWQVDATALADPAPFNGRTVLVSPFDQVVFDRARLQDLFGFEYLLEMYKPASARRWGYFALPILHGDRFVGKLDAKADRKAGVLRVDAVHEDAGFDDGVREAVEQQIGDLAAWLGLDVQGLA
ncbi:MULTISPECIES: crosslink repair DNA glycosylase YcaQ family protein [unclassified Microbacterium]|uniref:DNA glycosylase AlkZ-like family protein n=1 Tax=unclassified Microbacterium TaxID=2609290 RepID=UPI00214BE3CF|nr:MULTISPECIES: crosslink repair DNA glycosylase YcaQ family protein [unclassified Microbacterium]MCR2784352.1 winged helix DNA-binding domain-containing protein [Microbacterium sp. zg.B96]WIM14824.1 crosslink repair DNA glycosylase YcaQ family protein [Microbacterium sp. zg-B96]